jgi:S-adenosylhomocysteine hydrolase
MKCTYCPKEDFIMSVDENHNYQCERCRSLINEASYHFDGDLTLATLKECREEIESMKEYPETYKFLEEQLICIIHEGRTKCLK